jgi:hypothetical protein
MIFQGKANALFYELEEVGMNRQLGYTSPADLTELYPQFYWNSISPHIQTAIKYLSSPPLCRDGRRSKKQSTCSGLSTVGLPGL